MLCNAALMVRISNFYSTFKPNFLFEIQVVRASNRSTIEGPLACVRACVCVCFFYLFIYNMLRYIVTLHVLVIL